MLEFSSLSPFSTPFLQPGPQSQNVPPRFRIFLPCVENPSQTHPEVCLFDDSRLHEDGNQINYTLSQQAMTPQALLPWRPPHEWVALVAAPPPGLCAQAQGSFTLGSSVGSIALNFHPCQAPGSHWGSSFGSLGLLQPQCYRPPTLTVPSACTRSSPILSQEFPQSTHGASFPHEYLQVGCSSGAPTFTPSTVAGVLATPL